MPYTLIDLPTLLTDAAFRRPVVAAVQDDATLAAFWAEFEDMRPAQRAAVIASPLNKLRKIVMRKPLVRVLGQAQPRFRLRDIFREKKTVLVPLNDALLGEGAAKLLGSLIVAELFLATTERAAEKEPMKRPGMIFIDEVQNYLHLPTSVENAMSVFRSYGVGLHVAHQYRKQLPDQMRSGLDANARSKVCFALDTDDAHDMAKRAPALTAADFETLTKHHVYARLVAGSTPTEWCSAAVLPPAPDSSAADLIRDASREQYGHDRRAIPRRSRQHPFRMCPAKQTGSHRCDCRTRRRGRHDSHDSLPQKVAAAFLVGVPVGVRFTRNTHRLIAPCFRQFRSFQQGPPAASQRMPVQPWGRHHDPWIQARSRLTSHGEGYPDTRGPGTSPAPHHAANPAPAPARNAVW
ncbi:TraM recognition domain-containing protein [Microbacterium oxydans]|nr:TraM recognition domain-containing protein [Microbacterium oxydans]